MAQGTRRSRRIEGDWGMSDWDIVKSLRNRAEMQTATGITEPSEHIYWMAADEIKRLRTENEKLRAENEKHKEIAFREAMKNATLRVALQLMIDTQEEWEAGVERVMGARPKVFNRAIDQARAALKETG